MPARALSLLFLTLLLLPAFPASAREPLRVYGPGGPAPAMKEAARVFSEREGVQVEVTAGPASDWMERARKDAHLVFSGSEHMMSDFLKALDGVLDPATVEPLYLRRSAILVRPGNPRGLRDVPDLGRPGVRILVVNGAGQVGLWEDMVGRTGDLDLVRSVRRNIAVTAANTGVARTRWTEDPSLDAWIVWDIWQVSNPTLADVVTGSETYAIYRDCGAGLTNAGKSRPEARRFLQFLQSAEGEAIFRKWGWKAR